MARPRQEPTLKLHRATGTGYVLLDGRRRYLGAFDDPGTKAKAARLIAEWYENGESLPSDAETITIVELVARFWWHAETYYRRPDGSGTSTLDAYRQAMRPLKLLYGTCEVGEFGALGLRAVRMEMVRSGIARTTVNKYVGLIRAVFKWGVSHAIVPVGVHTALSTVEPLKRGRSEARETDAVKPVPDAQVDGVRPFISRQVWALIELQLLTAARSGELVVMRAIDLDTSDRIWTYRPTQHKTAHHGHDRVIYLGPKAQRVVEPFMSGRAVDAFLFSPQEAETERRADLRDNRTSPPSTNRTRDELRRARPKDRVGDRYTPSSYARAITRACDLAFPPPAPLAKLDDETVAKWNARLSKEQHEELAAWRRAHRWHPHQLRHNAGTRLRREFGVEAAQVVLGHARADVTQIYAEVNEAKARHIIGRVG